LIKNTERCKKIGRESFSLPIFLPLLYAHPTISAAKSIPIYRGDHHTLLFKFSAKSKGRGALFLVDFGFFLCYNLL
jgi:hypothetical protein